MPQITPPPPTPAHLSKKLTQQQKIVAIMCLNADTKKWWKAHELISYGGDESLFVGYEAGPRLSELTKDYPDIFETKKEGKFLLRRMKFETGKEWYQDAPDDIKLMVRRYYKPAEKA